MNLHKDSKDPYLPNLMKIRLLMTGFIYQFLFKRKLSFKQWISLLVLTGGCMIQKLNPDVISTNSKTDETEYVFMDGNSLFSSSLVLIMIQVNYFKYFTLRCGISKQDIWPRINLLKGKDFKKILSMIDKKTRQIFTFEVNF